jgi:hypothetical protein
MVSIVATACFTFTKRAFTKCADRAGRPFSHHVLAEIAPLALRTFKERLDRAFRAVGVRWAELTLVARGAGVVSRQAGLTHAARGVLADGITFVESPR